VSTGLLRPGRWLRSVSGRDDAEARCVLFCHRRPPPPTIDHPPIDHTPIDEPPMKTAHSAVSVKSPRPSTAMRGRPAAARSVALALLACAATSPAQAQDLSQVVALHSFADLPALPLTVPDLLKRYGDVSTPQGGTEKGDRAGEPLRQRIAEWMKPTGVPPAMNYAAMMGGAGAMSPAAGQALGQLAQTLGQMTSDYSEAVQTFGLKTMPPLRQAYEARLTQIHKTYDPQIEHCLSLNERAGGSSCTDPSPQRVAAINAAGTAFLHQAANAYGDYRNRLQSIAAEGETAIDRATKAFGGSAPVLAQTQIASIRQNEVNDLAAALTAETDLVVYVHEHAALPTVDR
jgi:hypothetical protein